MDSLRDTYILKRTEILIVLANDKEAKGFNKALANEGIVIGKSIDIDGAMIFPFISNGYHMCYFVSNRIGSGVRTALETVASKFQNLNYIVNLGCCATKKECVENDVIYAECIFDAELRKEEEVKTIYYCSVNRHLHSGNNIKIFLNGLDNKEYKIIYGPIISSSAVVKENETKTKYLEAYPTAEGIEMEGVNLSEYALAQKIEWILIKGTSDNCSNKKGGAGQEKVTTYASNLFFELIKNNVLKKMKPAIFIGGAVAPDYEFNHVEEYKNVEQQSYELGKAVYCKNFKIINGLGVCVGTSLVASAYDYCFGGSGNEIADCIETFPFPRRIGKPVNELYRAHRKRMIDKSTIALFIFGDGTKKGKNNGMFDEYEEARACLLPRLVIPSKGYYSEELFNQWTYDAFGEKAIKECKKIKISNSFRKNISIALKAINEMDLYFYSNK